MKVMGAAESRKGISVFTIMLSLFWIIFAFSFLFSLSFSFRLLLAVLLSGFSSLHSGLKGGVLASGWLLVLGLLNYYLAAAGFLNLPAWLIASLLTALLVGFPVDILREKRALSLREKKIEQLFHGAIEAFARFQIMNDEQGTAADYQLLEVNPSFEAELGMMLEDIKGEKASDIFNDQLVSSFNRLVINDGEVSCEVYLQPPGGWFEVRAFSPNNASLVASFTNISHQRRIQRSLEGLLESLEGGIIITDEEGRISSINNRVCRLLGKNKEELLGSFPGSLMRTPKGEEQADDNLINLISSGRVRELTTGQAVILVSQRLTTVRVKAAPIGDEEGNLYGSVLLLQELEEDEVLDV